MRILLAVLTAMSLTMSLIFPAQGLICAVLFVFLFIKMPGIAKYIFETRWAQEAAARAAEMDGDDGDDDDDEGDDDPDIGYDLNQRGMQYEKSGDEGNAVRCYELAVNERTDIPYPYRRLAIIYRKRKQWEDVVRICEAALAVLPGHAGKWCEPEQYGKWRDDAVSKLDTNQD